MSAKKWEKKWAGQRSRSAERPMNPMTWNRGNCEKPEISREKEKSLAPTVGLSWFLCFCFLPPVREDRSHGIWCVGKRAALERTLILTLVLIVLSDLVRSKSVSGPQFFHLYNGISFDICYGLNCIPPKFIYWSPNLQNITIFRERVFKE